MTAPGHNANASDDRLRLLIERVERLEEEKKGIADDIRDVYAEARAVGYDTKIMRQVVRLRKMKPNDRREMEAVLDTYKAALGVLMRWLRFLRRNRPADRQVVEDRRHDRAAGISPVDHQEIDWRPGDLAECLHPGPWFAGGLVPHACGPTTGEIRVVVAVRWGFDVHGRPAAFLGFARWPDRGYVAVAFRRIVPRADAQFESAGARAEPDFVPTLKPHRETA